LEIMVERSLRHKEAIMTRSKTGEAISQARRTKRELAKLSALHAEAENAGDLKTWRRTQAVIGYLDGKKATALAEELRVVRGAVYKWLRWYEVLGAEGLRVRKSPGAPPRLSNAQKEELAEIIEAGPQSVGLTSGLWTGPMVGDVIFERYGVRYHHQHIPRLLHQLGFSVQRPRKRLARADAEAQAVWLRERLPAIKKKRRPVAAS
jgi:transposase